MPPVFSRETHVLYARWDSRAGQGRTSPCERRCPAGNPIQTMEKTVAAGRHGEALACLRARNPFPGVTGRVCPHPCEEGCNRARYDEAVSIRALERFAADHGTPPNFRPRPATGKRLAVVGAGPAGLSTAYFAALLGHEVTVFEASPVAGGVPRLAIPDFRLPKTVVDREVGQVLALGVTVLTNTAVGRDVSLSDLLDRFDACVLAVGNSRERRLDIPGIEASQPAVAFLRASNLDRKRLDGRKVVILGGGGVAFDCAFTAKRLGAAEVHLVFPEDREHIRAPREEVIQAVDEGVSLHPGHLAAAVRLADGRAAGVKADAVSSFRFDERGALHVERVPGQGLYLGADRVICASGLMADLDFLDAAPGVGSRVERTARGFVVVDEATRATTLPGLFAAGECASGPSLVAAAVGEGRRAAFAAHAFVSGMDMAAPLDAWFGDDGPLETRAVEAAPEVHEVEFSEIVNIGHHPQAVRRTRQQVAARDAWPAFDELDRGLTAVDAEGEAARCLHCGHCQSCGECVASCPGLILKAGERGPEVAYPDECWHCGCCRLACPGACIAFKFPLHTYL